MKTKLNTLLLKLETVHKEFEEELKKVILEAPEEQDPSKETLEKMAESNRMVENCISLLAHYISGEWQ